jgi:N-glycosylase/DNA lyase
MEEWNLYWNIITIVLGATGLWKLIELLFKMRLEKRLREAETKNLNVQAEGQIVGNWIQWSQHLEQRVKELEAVADDNRKLMQKVESQRMMIESQKARIIKLEATVELLTKEKNALEKDRGRIIKLEKRIENLNKERIGLLEKIKRLKHDAA